MGRTDHFERHGEPALLPAGKDAHLAVADFIQPHIVENPIHALLALVGIEPAHAQAQRTFHALPDGQQIVGDAELRDVADLVRGHVAILGKVPPVPLDVPHGGFAEAADDLEQRALSAAGRPDHGGEVLLRKADRNLREQQRILGVGAELEGDLLEFEHARTVRD